MKYALSLLFLVVFTIGLYRLICMIVKGCINGIRALKGQINDIYHR